MSLNKQLDDGQNIVCLEPVVDWKSMFLALFSMLASYATKIGFLTTSD